MEDEIKLVIEIENINKGSIEKDAEIPLSFTVSKSFNTGQPLCFMDFQYEDFEAETFKGIDLSGVSFKGTKFVDCIFEDCNLSNVDLHESRFQDVIFKQCKVLGLNFLNCNDLIFSFEFENSFISLSCFSDMDLKNTKFINCQIYECDFINTNLKNGSFEGSDLKDSKFHNTDLSFVLFRNAKNYTIDPNNNNLKKARFSIPEVLSLLNIYDIELE